MVVIVCNNPGTFNAEVENAGDKLVVIHFSASWSAPCDLVRPLYEKLSEKAAEHAVFLEVDVDQNELIADKYEADAMPCFLLMKDREKRAMVIGAAIDRVEESIEENKDRPEEESEEEPQDQAQPAELAVEA
mmetsp:Transcript_4858/g.13232  ORF Transcript_4858/g.13232 Transcript_4858/m.13232 type:complete len:132 (+) Transcript_4858:53-448(+)